MGDWAQVSINQVISSLNNFATSHQQIHSFKYGLNSTQEASQSDVYPQMRVYPDSFNVGGTGTGLEFVLRIDLYDLQQNNEDNTKDVHSDLAQVAVDCVNFLRRNQGYYWNVKSSTRATPFVNRNVSTLAGWSFTITLNGINFSNICDIPGVDPGTPMELDFTDSSSGCFNFPCLTATTFYAGTIYSGTTDLSTIINSIGGGSGGSVSENIKHTSFGITVDGSGDVISTGSKGYTVIPFSGTVTDWYVVSDISGTTQFDLKRNSVSIIGAGNKPLLSSAQRNNAAVASWTSTAIGVNDEIEFVVESGTTLTRVNLIIKITKL